MKDHNAIDRARAGDAKAFADAFEALRPNVFAIACRLVGLDAAEDVVMDTYLKAWRGIGGFRGTARLRSWLYRVTYNCAMDHIRRRDRRHEVSLEAPDTEGHSPRDVLPDAHSARPSDAVENAELAAVVDRAMAHLPAAHRTSLLLRYADGFSYAEIAAATGVRIGTVMSRLFHAKRKLRLILESEGS